MRMKGFTMRKFVLAATVAVAASMLSPLAASAATSNDSVDGNGSAPVFGTAGATDVHFNSTANFNGTEPRGSFRLDAGSDTFQGDVTCVIVNGNTAIVGGFIDHALSSETFMGLPANSFSVNIMENGSSGDQMDVDIGPNSLDFLCGEGFFSGPMTQSDVSVHDG
jgi:hypothetical protein